MDGSVTAVQHSSQAWLVGWSSRTYINPAHLKRGHILALELQPPVRHVYPHSEPDQRCLWVLRCLLVTMRQ